MISVQVDVDLNEWCVVDVNFMSGETVDVDLGE